MTKSIRQEARLKALEQLARRRADLAAREARIRAHVMAISTAAMERDATVADAERRIGEALHALTVTESMTTREAATLSGITLQEANRILRGRSQEPTPTQPTPTTTR